MITVMYVHCLVKCYYWFCICLVPNPVVNVTALDDQTVGENLTLQCEVTTVRGITSRVDIVWSSNDTVLRRINDTTPTMLDDSLVYTDSYTTEMPLSTSDHGRVITCQAVIDVDPPVMGSGSITLDVFGEYYAYSMYVCSPTVYSYIH